MSYPLEHIIDVDIADVHKAGEHAARLVRLPDRVRFEYLDGYVSHAGQAVATTLPLSDEPVDTHSPGALPPFFAGLLPEGRRSTALRTAIKTSADDELSLLLAVGSDTVGDVQIVPIGETPRSESLVATDDFADLDFAQVLELSLGSNPDRTGLAGVQDKVSARMISLPISQQGTAGILKLDPPEFPHLTTNEAFFLQAARDTGLNVAHSHLVTDANGVHGLLVERFDRTFVDGVEHSLAVEDACQVAGRYPADKYKLSSEQMATALLTHTLARPVAARDLFAQIVFAYLSCNGDAHAKNFSILANSDGEWKASPAYDLPSTHPYGDHSLALRLNGKRREDIGRADVLEFARQLQLPEKAAIRVLDRTIEDATWIERLDELPFDPQRTHKLRKAILYRRDRLRS